MVQAVHNVTCPVGPAFPLPFGPAFVLPTFLLRKHEVAYLKYNDGKLQARRLVIRAFLELGTGVT